MRRFFYPKSIAVAGVSPEEDKISNVIIANLLEMNYKGEIFAVGQKRGEIFGRPIHCSLDEIPGKIDLLVVMVPAFAVPALLKDAGKVGIDRAVILTAGFNELGEKGDLLAREIKETAARYSIRFIGPNCQGVICANSGVCVPFGPLSSKQVKEGGISIVAQSGSVAWMGTSVLSHEIDGISKVASIGNKLDVDELDLLEFLMEDPETETIVLYLESLSDGRRLYELAGRSQKPIILFKSNISGKKSEIAFSHTAALSSDDAIVDAAVAQAGILRAHTFREMIEMCKCMSLPLLKDNNVVILASSGGMGLIGEDTILKEKLHLPELPDHLIREIREMGDWDLINITNPIDIGGFFNNSNIINLLDTVLSFNNVAGAVLSVFNAPPPLYTPYESSEVVSRVQEVSERQSKPITMHFVSDPLPIEQIKTGKTFPLFDTMEDAVRALSTQLKYRKMQKRICSAYRHMEEEKAGAQEVFSRMADNSSHPSDLSAMELVMKYGIECEMPLLAVDPEDARRKAGEIGYPVAMKISSPDIYHKTDVGGVIINIRDEKELKKSYFEIIEGLKKRNKQIKGVMLQKMISGGIELILGGRYDHDFGPVIIFGMGGIFVEAFKDVSLRLAPICREEAYEMIEETKGFSLLQGSRGEKPFDISSIADALERLSVLLSDFPQLTEIDLNPVKVFNDGRDLVVVDAKLKTGLGL